MTSFRGQAIFKELTMASTRLALCEVRGLLNDIVDRLSGDEGTMWAEALKKTCRKENPCGTNGFLHQPPREFKVWKTVKLHTGINADGYRKAINGKKVGKQK